VDIGNLGIRIVARLVIRASYDIFQKSASVVSKGRSDCHPRTDSLRETLPAASTISLSCTRLGSTTILIACSDKAIFDFLLEKQYDLIPRFVNPVVDEEQLSLNIARDGTLLLKLHGDLWHPSRLVVTEGDYDAFLTKYPLIATYLANLLITKTAVLIGYSLDDPNFRQVWQVVAQRLGKTRRQAYAIAVGAQPADAARFARRGVTLINLPLSKKKKYGEVLAEVFDELAAYWRDNVLDVSMVTEEAPLRELKLPKESSSRLVFFAVPLHRLPVYRERVFTAVGDMGLVPVTADDVISPGDSISAKIDALMDRAVAIVVEVGSTWPSAELRLALSRAREGQAAGAKAPKIIVVGEVLQRGSSSDTTRQFFTRIEDNPETDAGLLELLRALSSVVPLEATEKLEPKRLLDKGEYRAAVISAMSLLEASLRMRLEKPDWSRVNRPMSMRQLLEATTQAGVLQNNNIAQVEEWSKIRNNVVHGNAPVGRDLARTIVNGVLALIASLT
jgi:hypothetical protein